jgi:hypothetical protein
VEPICTAPAKSILCSDVNVQKRPYPRIARSYKEVKDIYFRKNPKQCSTQFGYEIATQVHSVLRLKEFAFPSDIFATLFQKSGNISILNQI